MIDRGIQCPPVLAFAEATTQTKFSRRRPSWAQTDCTCGAREREPRQATWPARAEDLERASPWDTRRLDQAKLEDCDDLSAKDAVNGHAPSLLMIWPDFEPYASKGKQRHTRGTRGRTSGVVFIDGLTKGILTGVRCTALKKISGLKQLWIHDSPSARSCGSDKRAPSSGRRSTSCLNRPPRSSSSSSKSSPRSTRSSSPS